MAPALDVSAGAFGTVVGWNWEFSFVTVAIATAGVPVFGCDRGTVGLPGGPFPGRQNPVSTANVDRNNVQAREESRPDAADMSAAQLLQKLLLA